MPDNLYAPARLTLGAARVWARRLRKVGFGPVTVHHMDKTIIDYPVNAYFLRCHWPYRSDDLPEDLYSYLAGYDGLVSTMRCAYSHTDAQDLLERYRTVRLGMGSKPLPTQHRNHNPIGYEASIVPATRIAYDRDDWPSYTQVHPDWEGWSLTVSPVLGRYPDGRS